MAKEESHKLQKIDFIHFSSATGFLEGKLKDSYNELFKLALKNNIKFSFDPNFRDKLWITDEEIIKKSNMFANQTVQYLGALSFLEHLK